MFECFVNPNCLSSAPEINLIAVYVSYLRACVSLQAVSCISSCKMRGGVAGVSDK